MGHAQLDIARGYETNRDVISPMQLLRGQPWSAGNYARAGDGEAQVDSAVFCARQGVAQLALDRAVAPHSTSIPFIVALD